MSKQKVRNRNAVLGAVPSGIKLPATGFAPTSQKIPKIAHEPTSYLDRKASWRLSKVQLADPYGWHELPLERLGYIQGKLALFETMTWDEIFTVGHKRNHPIEVTDLRCKKAKKWMEQNMPDQPTLWTLRFAGAERVWGIFAEGAYQIIFWDPEHLIFPSER